jgi:hypothetical protein
MLTFCHKCITICYIKGFDMIPKIFETPKIIIDYLFQVESDLDATFLSNQNSSISADLSLDLMTFALRYSKIILNISGDIFRTHPSQGVYVALFRSTFQPLRLLGFH